MAHASADASADAEAAAVRLAAFVRAYLRAIVADGGHQSCSALMLWEAVQPSEAIDAVVRDYIRPSHDALVALLRRLLPKAERPRARLYARSLLGQILHYRICLPFIERIEEAETGGSIDVEEAARHVIGFTLRGMGHDERFIERVRRTSAATPAVSSAVPSAGMAATLPATLTSLARGTRG